MKYICGVSNRRINLRKPIPEWANQCCLAHTLARREQLAAEALKYANNTLLHGETFKMKYYNKCAIASRPWEERWDTENNHKAMASILLDDFSVDEITRAEKGLVIK